MNGEKSEPGFRRQFYCDQKVLFKTPYCLARNVATRYTDAMGGGARTFTTEKNDWVKTFPEEKMTGQKL